jgi:rSAM/selenodomain-associated transferase 1
MRKRKNTSQSTSPKGKRRRGKVLILWVKFPTPGKVKLKLSRSLGPEKASSQYREMSEKTLQATRPEHREYDRIIFYDPETPQETYEKWLGDEIPLLPQKGKFLAERLKNAVAETLQNYEQVILMGSDKPSLTQGHVALAFQAMEKSEVVFGPTSEGGFYLLGFKKLIPEIFERTLWSTPFVFDTLFKVLSGMDMDPHLMPVLAEES